MNVIIINGPNLNLLGKRETSIYGKISFEDFLIQLRSDFDEYKIHYYQSNIEGELATEEYIKLAKESGLNPAQMALAFVYSRPFVTSAIVGATTLEQLKHNLDSINLNLSEDVIQAIESIHRMHPNPCP